MAVPTALLQHPPKKLAGVGVETARGVGVGLSPGDKVVSMSGSQTLMGFVEETFEIARPCLQSDRA